MRRAFLLRSVARVLGGNMVVHDAAYMWARHRWMMPFAGAAFAAVALLAPIAGINEGGTRIALGLAAAGVAVMASTEYRVVAQTDGGIVLLEASKIRQVATDLRLRLEKDDPFQSVGGTVLAADWQVGEYRYTVPRSSEQAMQRMAATRPTD